MSGRDLSLKDAALGMINAVFFTKTIIHLLNVQYSYKKNKQENELIMPIYVDTSALKLIYVYGVEPIWTTVFVKKVQEICLAATTDVLF